MNLSVALCTYNGSRFLQRQLDSIAAQHLQPIELVICDDGSTDSTAEIVATFSKTVSFPVFFHCNPVNLGSTKNFEQAIRLCTGEVIALCDQDDDWAPEKLATMSAVLEANPQIAGIFSNAKLMDGDGNSSPGDLWTRVKFPPHELQKFTKASAPFRLMDRDMVTGATLLFRASYLSHLLPISDEWFHDGWIAMILASVAELRPFPASPMTYRLHASQQVGLTEVPWHAHLKTQKEKAIASHLQRFRRLSAMLVRLEALGADPLILTALRRQTGFFADRADALQLSRTRRLIPAFRLLGGYFAQADGVMSLLRDLLH